MNGDGDDDLAEYATVRPDLRILASRPQACSLIVNKFEHI